MNAQWVEILGYVASALILISMMMSSILRLRIINVVGSTLFAVYGLIIESYPVFIVNGAIALTNVYYLAKFFTVKEVFKTIEVRGNNLYLKEFLEFYRDEIKKYFPHFKYEPEKNRYSFFILRNMNVAGIFMAREFSPGTLWITLDFATPEYRDFKVGRFVYTEYAKKFLADGFTRLITKESPQKSHQRYLSKMGFKKEQINGEVYYVKNLI